MHAEPASGASRSTRPGDLLSPRDVERDYSLAENTQAVWRCENRYGFRGLVIKLGRSVRYRRSDLEQWLESRRLLVEP